MRILFLLLSFLPAIALAQSEPMVVVDDSKPTSLQTHEDIINNFPDWAVTNVGKNTTGHTEPTPPAPAVPAAAATPVPKRPDAPKAPETPETPINKLWPMDTVPIFMRACVGIHIELISPCKCTITRLMQAMPHDEFLRLSLAGSIEQDARLSQIRYQCVGTPRQKQ